MISLMVESTPRQCVNKTRQKFMGGGQTGGYQRGRMKKGQKGARVLIVW